MTTHPPPEPRAPRIHREVVSYVRRSARMRPHQRAAWEAYRDRYVLEVARRETSTSVHPDATIDLAAAFGREARLVVEIGPGTGESLLPMAAARPETDLLAFEVYQPALAQVLAGIGRRGLGNVRLVEADAGAGLRHLLPNGCIDELWLFFPDPWPKAKHHKRRLVRPEFADVAAAKLRPGATWRLATDWSDYAERMREVLDAHPRFVNTADGWAQRFDERPVTRFERRGTELGRRIFDLCYRRADDAAVPRG